MFRKQYKNNQFGLFSTLNIFVTVLAVKTVSYTHDSSGNYVHDINVHKHNLVSLFISAQKFRLFLFMFVVWCVRCDCGHVVGS